MIMVAELFEQVRKYHLSAPAAFLASDIETLQKCYNGIGPECWPVLLRKLVSELLQLFAAGACVAGFFPVACALVHDFEFSQSEKSYRHFTQANVRLALNCVMLAFVGPVRLVRPVRQNRLKLALFGVLLAVACQIWGYKAYKTGGNNV